MKSLFEDIKSLASKNQKEIEDYIVKLILTQSDFGAMQEVMNEKAHGLISDEEWARDLAMYEGLIEKRLEKDEEPSDFAG